ncbi:hypothetical protein JY651_05110 [Pyxidicoccus parkwayensis]|uniref:Uncharacterized protein n=1 Tax=Pyxidicoccus parkwayensis TaxID=2813578 RepID=A0ABX7NZI4_9BACT|nr:hypothetical protein [Pyxidicoccus parkwaysis]QSQ24345.1 hypothetical protein JY651_05110 [Pyxidicoccus parkwaysis]
MEENEDEDEIDERSDEDGGSRGMGRKRGREEPYERKVQRVEPVERRAEENDPPSEEAIVFREGRTTLRDRRPLRWIIHPGHLAGDGWHIVAALLVEPELRVAIVVLTEIRALWMARGSFEAFLPRALERLTELHDTAPAPSTIAKQRKKRGYNAAGLHHRAIRHWAETTALLESIAESGISFERIVLVPGLECWEEIDNPYLPARRLVEENNALVGIQPGDFVGMTQASTSCVARWLHVSRGNTIDLLRLRLAPVTMDGATEAIANALRAHLARVPRGYRVLVVMMRKADENRQHNTTLAIFQQLLELVRSINTRESGYYILPLGGSAARTHSDETGVPIPSADCILPPFNMFSLLEQLDRRAEPARTTRSLVAEFWRVLAGMENVCLFGGRSGSLDIAAFMGVRRIYCFDVLQMKESFVVTDAPGDWAADDGNIRLFLTWRLMTIGFLDHQTHLLAPDSVRAFLAGQDQDPAALGRTVLPDLGYDEVFRVARANELTAVSNAGVITSSRRRWALLMYLATQFPSIEAFFPGQGGGAPTPPPGPAPYDLDADATERQSRNTCGVRASWNAGAYAAGRRDALTRGFIYAEEDELPIDSSSDDIRESLDERQSDVSIVESTPDLAALVTGYRNHDFVGEQIEALTPVQRLLPLVQFAARERPAATFVLNTRANGANSLSAARGGLHWIAVHVTRDGTGRLQFRFADSAGHGREHYRTLFDRLHAILH